MLPSRRWQSFQPLTLVVSFLAVSTEYYCLRRTLQILSLYFSFPRPAAPSNVNTVPVVFVTATDPLSMLSWILLTWPGLQTF